jgi:hypothetical protein
MAVELLEEEEEEEAEAVMEAVWATVEAAVEEAALADAVRVDHSMPGSGVVETKSLLYGERKRSRGGEREGGKTRAQVKFNPDPVEVLLSTTM